MRQLINFYSGPFQKAQAHSFLTVSVKKSETAYRSNGINLFLLSAHCQWFEYHNLCFLNPVNFSGSMLMCVLFFRLDLLYFSIN